MPALDATTTAVFASTGITPSMVYNVLTTLAGTGVSFLLWLTQLVFPFVLVVGAIALLIGLIWKFAHLHR